MITSLANYLPGNSRKAPNILHGQIPWGAMAQWKIGAQQTWPGCIFIYAIFNKIYIYKDKCTYKLVWTAASACPARPVSAWAQWGRSWGQSQGSSSCWRGQLRRGWGRPPALSLTSPREDMGAWLSRGHGGVARFTAPAALTNMDWSDWEAKHKINIPGCSRARRYFAAGRAVNDGRHETLGWHYGIMHRGRLLGYTVICSHCSQRFYTREADPCLELEHTPLANNIVHFEKLISTVYLTAAGKLATAVAI